MAMRELSDAGGLYSEAAEDQRRRRLSLFRPFVIARQYDNLGRCKAKEEFRTYSEAVQWAYNHTRPGLIIHVYDVNVRGGRYAEYTHEQLA